MTKRQNVMVGLALTFNILLCVVGFIMTRTTRQSIRVGTMLVDLMYNFDSFEELPDKYLRLYRIVDDDVWSKVDANNPYRFAWAYSRFRGKYCHSVVSAEYPGLVLYRMHTPYISPSRHWCIMYSVSDNLLDSIEEYEFVPVSTGGDGGQGITYDGP